MKDKIIEILRGNTTLHTLVLIPDSQWIIMRDDFEQIADEILALPFSCPSCECDRCNGVENDDWYKGYKTRMEVE